MLATREVDLGDGAPARLAKRLNRLAAGRAHLRVAVVPQLPGDDPDSQPVRLAGRQLLAEQDAAQQPAVGGVAAHRPGDDRRRRRRRGGPASPSGRRSASGR